MDLEQIKELLGKFAEEFYKPKMNHFRHVIGNSLVLADTEAMRGRPDDAKVRYDSIRRYAQVLRENGAFREREFREPIPEECNMFDVECAQSIDMYLQLVRERKAL